MHKQNKHWEREKVWGEEKEEHLTFSLVTLNNKLKIVEWKKKYKKKERKKNSLTVSINKITKILNRHKPIAI